MERKVAKPKANQRGHKTASSAIFLAQRALSRASVEPHPFLEDRDLARVHDWRSAIEPFGPLKMARGLAALPPPSDGLSTRKNEPISSNWPKTPSKKRKTAA